MTEADPTVTWDYTALAERYDDRAPYAEALGRWLMSETGLHPGQRACDIGAGTGALTERLINEGLEVTAVEPNAAMARFGQRRAPPPAVTWRTATAERSGLPSAAFDLVSFGSSFNVTQRPAALDEAARLLKAKGWLLLLWNHRDLSDPLQASIEREIQGQLPDYRYGARREDQSPLIHASGHFEAVRQQSLPFVAQLEKDRFLRGWAAHATLQRQAGERFPGIIKRLEKLIDAVPGSTVAVPYETKVTLSRRLR